MANTIPTSILDTLIEDLLALTADGFLEAQAYAAHPGGGNAVIVETYTDEGEIDGFNLTRTVVPESFETFVRHVVPQMQERGRYKTAYTPGTLRNKLFGKGDRRSAALSATAFA